jgi:hypothetical protein
MVLRCLGMSSPISSFVGFRNVSVDCFLRAMSQRGVHGKGVLLLYVLAQIPLPIDISGRMNGPYLIVVAFSFCFAQVRRTLIKYQHKM